MTDVLTMALQVIDQLNRHSVGYVAIGSVAVTLHGLARGTEALEFVVRPEPDNIDRLRQALKAVWDDPNIDDIRAEDLCGEFPSVRYGPPSGPFYLDILARLGEMASFDDVEAEIVTIEGVPVRVATPRALYHLEKGTVRPIDHADAAALGDAFDLDEEG